jgi:hypothetical protein
LTVTYYRLWPKHVAGYVCKTISLVCILFCMYSVIAQIVDHIKLSFYLLQLLIPTVSVLEISKEKTARIIPNAIGVVTGDDKHVFCSLLSRDSTYRLMVHVWNMAQRGSQNPLPSPKVQKFDTNTKVRSCKIPSFHLSSTSKKCLLCHTELLKVPLITTTIIITIINKNVKVFTNNSLLSCKRKKCIVLTGYILVTYNLSLLFCCLCVYSII